MLRWDSHRSARDSKHCRVMLHNIEQTNPLRPIFQKPEAVAARRTGALACMFHFDWHRAVTGRAAFATELSLIRKCSILVPCDAVEHLQAGRTFQTQSWCVREGTCGGDFACS